jgi:alpha-L-rhamnosidase
MNKPNQKIAVVIATVLSPILCFGGLTPGNLQCESLPNPIGISESSPRLSWQLNETVIGERGQYQTAYQVLVASSPQLLAGETGDLWNSGEVFTNATAQIVYNGQALTSQEVCYWQLRVWDKNGQVSAWSPMASWSMGLMAQSDWTAQWVGRDDGPAWNTGSTFLQANWIWFPEGNPASSAPVATRWFRKTFTVPAGISVTQAVATMTADNMFTLYVNGQIALSAESPNYWQQYGQADISPFLVNGTNVLAVAATNVGTSANPAGLIGSFDLAYSNGQTNSFRTDGTWITTSNLLANWNATNFTASGWSNAMMLGTYGIGPWNGFAKTYLAATHVRKDFTLSTLPPRAMLYVTGQGLVEPHLNGAKVGNDYFVPGWTDYTNRLYYFTYDVTSLLEPGSNTLGAILGDGWYRGNCAFDGQYFYGMKTRLLAQLYLFYTNGTQIIGSDPTWQAGFGPILQADNEAGESYDALLEIPGWDSPGYTNPAWKNVTTGAEISPTIQAYPKEPEQTNQALVPVAITQPQPGLYVVNFGQNIAGWVRLQVTNQPAGRRIVMRFGERLNADGTVFRDNLRTALAMDTYICKGGGIETWEPRFTYHGFQYMEVQGLTQSPTTNTFTAMAVYSGLTNAGSFQCSNGQINQIYSNMLWSVRDNYFDVPTDCPQRDERAGWCGDGIQIIRTGMFNMQVENLFEKWCQDIGDSKARATTSDFGQQAPLVGDFGFSAAWQDSVVFVPYWLYQTYGDLRPAQRYYTNMVSHLAYYGTHSSNFIGPNSGYGDWVAVDNSTPLNLISTAFYARCASMMAEMAQALGKSSDVATYQLLFTNICSAFQTNFVAGDGTVGSGSQGGYLLALYFNLLTPAQTTLAQAKLVGAVNAQNGHPSTGMTTTLMLLPTLAAMGRSDLAYQMLAKTDYPSWGYEISLGATSIFELWDALNADGTVNTGLDGMNSLNHANFGTCAEWFYRGILGIDLLQPGFRKILISPQLGGNLTWARGYYDSIQGRIASAWQITNGMITLNVTIPPGCTAVVNLPTFGVPGTNLVIQESGTNIWQNGAATGSDSGVGFDSTGGTGSQTYVAWDLGSGSYQFNWVALAPPSGLTAQAGNGWVGLNWNPVPGATSYQVLRSLISGGPYTPLTNIVFTTNFTDMAVTNGVAFYYVVSAVVPGGTSVDSAEASATPEQILDFGFETPGIGAGNYEYAPSGAAWTFGGSSGSGSGITGNGSGFTAFNSPAPEGVQVAFLQSYGAISQTLTGFASGTNYTITFFAAQRNDSGNQHGGESWNVDIDSQVVASYNPGAGATSYSNYTAKFTATATSHTLSFVGTDLATGDNTVFIDDVRISPSRQPGLSAVALTSPTNNASFLSATTINLAAQVTTNGNTINNVQFYANYTNLVAQVTGPYNYSWSNVTSGAYSVFARVVFNGGGIADSPVANIVVTNLRPVIGGIAFESGGRGLTVSGTGQSAHSYAINVATNLIPPVAWTPLLTNQSDASGNIFFTNVPATSAQLFFRLSVP